MNIVIDIRCLTEQNRTGVGEYTYELLNALFAADTHNQYFLFYNSRKDVSRFVPRWKQENVHYVETRYPNKLLNLLLWFGIVKLDALVRWKSRLQNQKIDYFFSPNLNFFSLSQDITSILTIHDLSFAYFKNCFTFKRRLWHWFVNPRKQCMRAHTILTPSEHTRRDVIREFNIADNWHVHVVRPRLPDMFMRPEMCSLERLTEVKTKYKLPEKFMLYLGTLEPRKNIATIIESFKRSSVFTTNICHLVVAGTRGWDCENIIKEIDHTGGVHYIGYVDAQDKPALYKLASAFVYPSLYEGFGLPVYEALAMKVPVITSYASSLPEVAQSQAHLINPHNVADIARAMQHIFI